MSVNFFDEKCLTKTDAGLFGIYDSTDLSQATLDFTQASKWVCSVQNEAGLMLEFRAIDHCVVILREDGNQEKSCDAMLTYSENIKSKTLERGRNYTARANYQRICNSS
jgi:hypothetical protein